MTLANSVNSSRILQKSTAYTRSFFMGVTGLTLTVTISKAGAAFGAAAGAVSEITSGWYKIALTTADTGTAGDLAYHATDGGVNIEDFSDQVTAALPAQLVDAVTHGGTAAVLTLERIVAASTTTNQPAMKLTGNGTAEGLLATGGATNGNGGTFVGGGSLGNGLVGAGGGNAAVFAAGGDGILGGAAASAGSIGILAIGDENGANTNGFGCYGYGSDAAFVALANGNGNAMLLQTEGTGDVISISPDVAGTGHGITVAARGAGKHDINLAGDGNIAATITESFSALNAQPTLNQILHEIRQAVIEFAISGTTLTVKKKDGSTTALTCTLNSASKPTSRTRAT